MILFKYQNLYKMKTMEQNFDKRTFLNMTKFIGIKEL